MTTSIDPDRLAIARTAAELAWQEMPADHRCLLEQVQGQSYEVLVGPIGDRANAIIVSAGLPALSGDEVRRLDESFGAWIPQIRVMLVNAAHPQLQDLDEQSFEERIAWIVWHEWGHALSYERATTDDVAKGGHYLKISPPGVAGFILPAGYGRKELTHEVVANTYALLMRWRNAGGSGKPPFIANEIFDLMRRVTGWTT